MPFVQIIKFQSSKLAEMETLLQGWAAAETDGRVRRVLVCRDRNTPDQHFHLAFFDSYEEAMEHSDLPATQEFAARMAELVDDPPTFFDLDIVGDLRFD
jgi:hypothetical protein